MENLNPHWRNWLKNLGWYLATVVVLVLLFSFLRNFVVLAALWAVALIWGGVLAYQLSQALFGPAEIAVSEAQLQDYLQQTRAYKSQIDQAMRSRASKVEQIQMDTLNRRIEQWTAANEMLVQRLNQLRQDEVIRQDLRRVPKAIADLEKRLANQADPALQSQLEQALANRRKQLVALEQLQHTGQRAEIQIENTLSLLGTIYSQILTGHSTSDVALYSRLSADVDEEVRRLEDHLAALQEVKLGQVS
jgi:hypothetical protein